jgi:hypothetical protein
MWGPYADEAPTIARLHAFIEGQGYARSGKHHEIYLGDRARAAQGDHPPARRALEREK